ncbi:MAG: NAD(P)/FAD-dependent oxidoreductase, partial [Candidatus Methanospirareceae archaeon]
MSESYELIVVGGGPAGLTAAIYGARSGLESIVIEKGISGGLVNEAPRVENYPGFKEIKGMELVKRMKEQALEYVEIRELEEVKGLRKEGGGGEIRVYTDRGEY